MTATDITNEINGVLGPNTVKYQTVTSWIRNFRTGRSLLDDLPRLGRPKHVTTEENAAAGRDLITNDLQITIIQMAEMLKISGERIHHIFLKFLGARHLCVQWVQKIRRNFCLLTYTKNFSITLINIKYILKNTSFI